MPVSGLIKPYLEDEMYCQQSDLRLNYRRTLEISAVLALSLIILAFMTFPSFVPVMTMKPVYIEPIMVEEIPKTEFRKRELTPVKPSIPVIDVTVSEAADIPIIDVDDIIEYFPMPKAPVFEEQPVFIKVERMPQLIGGTQAIVDYLQKNNLLPPATKNGINGKALIEFVVNENGIPTELRIADEFPEDLGFGEAGIKVMSGMRFTPGIQRDKAVPVRMTQLILFTGE